MKLKIKANELLRAIDEAKLNQRGLPWNKKDREVEIKVEDAPYTTASQALDMFSINIRRAEDAYRMGLEEGYYRAKKDAMRMCPPSFSRSNCSCNVCRECLHQTCDCQCHLWKKYEWTLTCSHVIIVRYANIFVSYWSP